MDVCRCWKGSDETFVVWFQERKIDCGVTKMNQNKNKEKIKKQKIKFFKKSSFHYSLLFKHYFSQKGEAGERKSQRRRNGRREKKQVIKGEEREKRRERRGGLKKRVHVVCGARVFEVFHIFDDNIVLKGGKICQKNFNTVFTIKSD